MRKISIFLIGILLLFSVFGICIYAEETPAPELITEEVSSPPVTDTEPVPETFPGQGETTPIIEVFPTTDSAPVSETEPVPDTELTIDTATESITEPVTNTEPVTEPTIDMSEYLNALIHISYTEDSVTTGCVDYTINVSKKTPVIELFMSTDFGYEIYNDPNTDYIDGIRVDGKCITSTKFDIDPNDPPSEILVKIVYSNGASGMIAKLLDGNYDISELASNPIIGFQIFYYVLAVASIIIGGFGLVKSKRYKAKTAAETAEAVNVQAHASFDTISTGVIGILDTIIAPLIAKAVASNNAVVKATVLANSKAKGATADLLDLLEKSSDTNTSDMIKEAKESLKSYFANAEANKKTISEALNKIAEANQEGTRNENQTPETPTSKESRSIL